MLSCLLAESFTGAHSPKIEPKKTHQDSINNLNEKKIEHRLKIIQITDYSVNQTLNVKAMTHILYHAVLL